MNPKNYFKKNIYTILIVSTFAVWTALFARFVNGEIALIEDANVYYEHFKLYIEQLAHGVYPLWDPQRLWGVPNEFFLRRMGSFNPFYLIVLLLYKAGLPFHKAYFVFLSFYYFLGASGFYLLAKILFESRFLAFMAFVLLLLSSMSTLLINSFIILVFTPMIWFFFFLFSFGRSQQRYSFPGMVFCLMILVTTYIPFYFVIIFLVFALCAAIFYFEYSKKWLQNMFRFIVTQRIFAAACAGLLLMACWPGVSMFLSGNKSDMALAHRQETVMTSSAGDGGVSGNVFSVPAQTGGKGGVVPINFLNELFATPDEVFPGMLYVPIVTHIFFLLGFLVASNKRSAFLILFGFVVYLIAVYDAAPAYEFFYKYIFFFRYFRNYQFFLWLVLLPVYVLLVVEFLRAYLTKARLHQEDRRLAMGKIVALHLCFVALLLWQGHMVLSSLIGVVLSLIWFIYYLRSRDPQAVDQPVFLLLAVLMVTVSPLAMFHQLNKTLEKEQDYRRYGGDAHRFVFPVYGIRGEELNNALNQWRAQGFSAKPNPAYYDSQWANKLRSSVPASIIDTYISHKFIAYGETELSGESREDYIKFAQAVAAGTNAAYVQEKTGQSQLSAAGGMPEFIDQNSRSLKVLSFNVNSIVLRTNFSTPKYLVYNDAYHHEWRAAIDGKEKPVQRANFAFKGLWVPAGEHIVKLRFGLLWAYAFNVGLLVVFMITLFWLVFEAVEYKKRIASNVS